MKRLILLFMFASQSLGAQALERRYLAAIDESNWTLTDSSAVMCRMQHRIPRFGEVAFVQEAGRGLRFELKTRHRFERGVNVELRSETAAWDRRETRAVLARFETGGGARLFEVPSAVAEQMFYELRAGYQPGFLFYTDYPLIASLSTVRFGEAERAFTQCVGGLYRKNFDDVRISNILFDPDEEFASREQEERALARIFDYLRVDDAISEIVVTGHADQTGEACYNEGLSERRAWYVYDLLVARGISPELLRVDYYGEARPAKKGGGKNALAGNRRVTVELRR